MGYRGRLIHPLEAEIARLDTAATRDAGGYSDDLRTVKTEYPGHVGARASRRQELATVRLRCQVEGGQWDLQRQTANGDGPDTRLTLVFHFVDLEAAGLVDARTKEGMIRRNDRLVAIRNLAGEKVATRLRGPSVFATHAYHGGLGLGGNRNLWIVEFEDRPEGLTS